MKPVHPPALKKGDTIGIMAPSSRVNETRLKKAMKAMEARGFNVHVHPQTYSRFNQSAGVVEQKVEALHDLFRDKSIKAIFCACGGNRASTILPELNYKLIGKNPKIIMGYSDITALLHAIHEETGLVTFHGPMMSGISGRMPRKQLDQCFNLLAGKTEPVAIGRAKIISGGRAEGKLMGGNLSLISGLMGTPWQPNFKNALLFLEDCNEELSRLDRMFQQLANAGAFDQIAGLIMGSFTDTKDDKKSPFGFTLEDIVRDLTKDLDIPVVMNAPFGHGKDLYTLPVGAKAVLTAGKHSSIKFKGPVVR